MDKTYSYILSQIPDTIDFDFISVKNETTKSICLENISEQSILFKIENAEGFTFEPNQGIIPIKKKLEIKIKIIPNLANVLVANARIILDQKYKKIIRLSSIAKYPYLSINKSNIDFGSVQIGHTNEQELIVTNNESVPAKFSIERTSTQPGKQPCMFFISNLIGDIPPKSNFLIKILFKPMFPLNNSYETFLLSTKGGNKLMFSCSGYCRPLKTWVGAKNVNFKSVALGNQIKKLFRVYNDSDLPTEFQIYHDNSGAFFFDVTEGIIPGKSNVRVNVTFRPYETMIYYQRVFCIIRNHSLFPIDLFGSCHDLLIKTPLLDMRQIEIFRLKELKGLFFNTIDKKVELFDKLNNEKNNLVDDLTNDNNGNIKINNQQPQLHKEMFWETFSNTRIISFDTDLIDFNFVQSGTVSEPYILKVNNNSNEDMKIKFIFDKPINLNNLIKSINIFNSENTIFFTQPEERIIPSKSSGEFKVYFKPNKSEYYFYTDLPCQATILSSKDKKNNLLLPKNITIRNKSKQQLSDINKNQLSDFGKEMITHSIDFNFSKTNQNKLKSINTVGINKSIELNNNLSNNYFDPPITQCLSIVGHSFPPGTQIFMPMFELNPKKEMFFPPTTINQSLYQTLKIENKNDTPLFYKISPDPLGIFRVYCKYGLIPSKSFHLICVEFSPKETTVYRFPLRIIFNHDSQNMKTIMLNGLCTDPVIDIEGVQNEMYFPPSYVGIKTKKTVMIKNLSPIKILVNIKIDQMENGMIEVDEDSFEMGTNLIKKIDFYMTPSKDEEVNAHVTVTAERVYDPTNENIGIYNPDNKFQKEKINEFDRRIYSKEFKVLGRGSNGELRIEPEKLEFGTVKVGFHKKMFFSIYNPTITNFYIRLEPDFSGNITLTEDKNLKNPNRQRSDISFDFMEGLLNSFCKKDISIQFEPKTRESLSFKINVYATDNTSRNKELIQSGKNKNLYDNNENDKEDFNYKEELKCTIEVNAKGDYPLIKIVDVRNNLISTSKLWKDLNVDLANQELEKKLTNEEMNYSNSKSNKKIEDVTSKLKLIKFDFGKHFFKREKMEHQRNDIYLTLKNEGGVLSEFYFKFPDDVNIKREIWMDPVEPTSNDKVEYHVLKEQIFTIEPRKSKLEPGETCNIRIRYNVKERGQHRLRVIFQIVNGKPLIFELFGETLTDKLGILNIPKKIINFGHVPIGYTNFISSPIELKNISTIKIKYMIDYGEIDKYNKIHENFDVIKLESYEGAIGPGETKYILAYFRPLANINYQLNLTLHYTDDNRVSSEIITITGTGYHPLKEVRPEIINPFKGMPNKMIWNLFNNEMIQKCGFNIEELNFGEINEPKYKSFILYNYSNKYSFNFDFVEPGFLIKDELIIQPNKGIIDSGKYKIIKCILNPTPLYNSEYEGDILVKIMWNKDDDNMILKSPKKRSTVQLKNINNPLGSTSVLSKVHTIKRDNIYLRLVKKGIISEKLGNLQHKETTTNNSSFVETLIKDLTKQILSSNDFKNNFTKQVQEQPLSLYKWTNNESLPSLGQVRERYINNLKLLIISQVGDLSNEPRKKGKSFMELKSTHSKINSSQMNSNKQNSSGTNNLGIDIQIIKEEYNDALDNEIQEKYLKDLLVKYKYTIKEINERLILINDETKKLIADMIMENTIYNIICQTVYGEIDLTVKPRIYFFLGKGNNINVSESANIGNTGTSLEIKNENNLLKSDNSLNNKNNKEENKIEENQNSKMNSARKEENKSNVSLGSKNSKKGNA